MNWTNMITELLIKRKSEFTALIAAGVGLLTKIPFMAEFLAEYPEVQSSITVIILSLLSYAAMRMKTKLGEGETETTE